MRIMICDDNLLVIERLQQIVKTIDAAHIVGVVTNLAQLFDRLSQAEVDILLLDVNLPDGDGIDASIVIKKRFRQTKILIFSSLDDRKTLVKMIRNGVAGYLLKQATADEVKHAVNRISDGQTYYSQEILQKVKSIVRNQQYHWPPTITRREKQILQAIENGLSSKEIASKLSISIHTVLTHRKHLMAKLDVNRTINLLNKAKELGLIS